MEKKDKRLVLFVEDDSLIGNLVDKRLVSETINVTRVTTGEDALAVIEREPIKPSLVLLDIRLPGMDGFEVLEKIKAGENTKDIPVIIFSNFSEEKDKQRAMELGAKEYIVKVSMSLDEVVKLIKSHL